MANTNPQQQQQQPQHPQHQSQVATDSLFSMRLFNAERDLPIVYHSKYNMYFAGLELLHQFDCKKYAKISDHLSDEFLDTPYSRVRQYDEPDEEGEEAAASTIRPRRLRYLAPNRPVNDNELGLHHTADYLYHLHNDKQMIARVTEIWALNLVPMSVIESRLMNSLRLQVAGTVFAFHLAMQHGWSINLGGGFHQASIDSGETFCLMSDIFVAMKYTWRKHPLQKYMIIDLDAHQATGVERDLVDLEPKRRKMVYMLDVFNNSIQPPDEKADKGIDQRVELGRFTGDDTYLKRLDEALQTAVSRFSPNLIIYVGGQDVLKEDKLGLMNLSDEAMLKRDERVFSLATEKLRRPIVMLLGGGYSARGAKLQADSIRNLFAKGLIWGGHRSGSRSLSRPLRKDPNREGSSSGSDGSNERKPSLKTFKVAPQPQPPAPATTLKTANEPQTATKTTATTRPTFKSSQNVNKTLAMAKQLLANKASKQQQSQRARKSTTAATKGRPK